MSQPSGEVLAEIKRLMRETRQLIEGSSLPIDAALTVVLNTAYIVSAKRHGMSKEQMLQAFGNLWEVES